jgi:hypothetical protein
MSGSDESSWKNIGDASQDAIVSALRTRIKELEEALAPFAKIKPVTLDNYDGKVIDCKYYWVVIGSPNTNDFTRDDIEKAKKALSHEIG